ncbi:MAG: hypothetical protein J1F29_04735 [Lentimicrobiaceae bacterium]|nr:hypothetical protein [Lentimicrobiaceae bacterium]
MKTKTQWITRIFCLSILLTSVILISQSCEKEKDRTPIYRAPYEKELPFDQMNIDSIEPAIIQKFARDTACKHIYLRATDDNNFTSMSTNDINNVRNILDGRIQLAPEKISGRGDFWFMPRKANPDDSIWFVQHGWTVNQRRH